MTDVEKFEQSARTTRAEALKLHMTEKGVRCSACTGNTFKADGVVFAALAMVGTEPAARPEKIPSPTADGLLRLPLSASNAGFSVQARCANCGALSTFAADVVGWSLETVEQSLAMEASRQNAVALQKLEAEQRHAKLNSAVQAGYRVPQPEKPKPAKGSREELLAQMSEAREAGGPKAAKERQVADERARYLASKETQV